MRTIIHSKTLGVYLGFNFGGAFFSFVPTIFTHATTFESEAKAKEFAQRFIDAGNPDFPMDLEFLQVDTDSEMASMAVCVAAGVMPWEVDHVNRIEPFFSQEELTKRLEIDPTPPLSGVYRSSVARALQIDKDISPKLFMAQHKENKIYGGELGIAVNTGEHADVSKAITQMLQAKSAVILAQIPSGTKKVPG